MSAFEAVPPAASFLRRRKRKKTRPAVRAMSNTPAPMLTPATIAMLVPGPVVASDEVAAVATGVLETVTVDAIGDERIALPVELDG
jgi:hypothetical protein